MKKERTELVFIIDRSGSMNGLENDTIGGFNSMLSQQQAVEGDAFVTTVLFDDQYELLHDRVDIRNVAPMTSNDYTTRGSTALLDAVGITIHNIRKAQKSAKEENRADKVMFFIITDGHENSSRRYTFDMIRERIEHQKKKYGWEFVFFGANMDAIAEAAKLGIGANRSCGYCSNPKGTSSVYASISSMSTSFRTGGSFDLAVVEPENNPYFLDPKYMTNSAPLTREQPDAINNEPDDVKAALQRLKAAVKGVKKAADGLAENMAGLFSYANSHCGKLLDVNEIARQVFGTKDTDNEDQ